MGVDLGAIYIPPAHFSDGWGGGGMNNVINPPPPPLFYTVSSFSWEIWGGGSKYCEVLWNVILVLLFVLGNGVIFNKGLIFVKQYDIKSDETIN